MNAFRQVVYRKVAAVINADPVHDLTDKKYKVPGQKQLSATYPILM
jgi:hypothetical protein